MMPFYFGASERRLFGLYEPAAGGGAVERAAVLCQPFGGEYVFAHRSMRQLAVRLASVGFHTLRFDYFGTGDSAGEAAEADLAGSEADAELATEELRDIVGVKRITLIGLRLGATIAARVAAKRAEEVEAVVLWDPIISGEDYLSAKDLAVLKGVPPTSMLRDIRAIELAPWFATPPARTLVLITERRPCHEVLPAANLGRKDARLSIEILDDLRPWIENPDDAGGLPIKVFQHIAHWLT
jgi:pimeloyl-ACP methyl ester carboxylesterase